MHLHGYAALGLLVVPAAFAGGVTGTAASGGSSPQLPFAFVANQGQAADDVRFIGNGPGSRAQFRKDGLTVHQGGATARITFAGGAPNPIFEARSLSSASSRRPGRLSCESVNRGGVKIDLQKGALHGVDLYPQR